MPSGNTRWNGVFSHIFSGWNGIIHVSATAQTQNPCSIWTSVLWQKCRFVSLYSNTKWKWHQTFLCTLRENDACPMRSCVRHLQSYKTVCKYRKCLLLFIQIVIASSVISYPPHPPRGKLGGIRYYGKHCKLVCTNEITHFSFSEISCLINQWSRTFKLKDKHLNYPQILWSWVDKILREPHGRWCSSCVHLVMDFHFQIC